MFRMCTQEVYTKERLCDCVGYSRDMRESRGGSVDLGRLASVYVTTLPFASSVSPGWSFMLSEHCGGIGGS